MTNTESPPEVWKLLQEAESIREDIKTLEAKWRTMVQTAQESKCRHPLLSIRSNRGFFSRMFRGRWLVCIECGLAEEYGRPISTYHLHGGECWGEKRVAALPWKEWNTHVKTLRANEGPKVYL